MGEGKRLTTITSELFKLSIQSGQWQYFCKANLDLVNTFEHELGESFLFPVISILQQIHISSNKDILAWNGL